MYKYVQEMFKCIWWQSSLLVWAPLSPIASSSCTEIVMSCSQHAENGLMGGMVRSWGPVVDDEGQVTIHGL